MVKMHHPLHWTIYKTVLTRLDLYHHRNSKRLYSLAQGVILPKCYNYYSSSIQRFMHQLCTSLPRVMLHLYRGCSVTCLLVQQRMVMMIIINGRGDILNVSMMKQRTTTMTEQQLHRQKHKCTLSHGHEKSINPTFLPYSQHYIRHIRLHNYYGSYNRT